MRRVLSIVLALLFAFAIVSFTVSCNGNSDTESSTLSTTTSTESVTDISMDTTTDSDTVETTETETTTGDPGIVVDKDSDFNENRIVFTFAALSDTHIDSKTGIVANKFTNALKQLKTRASEDCDSGLGAVFVAGDLINSGYSGRGYYNEVTYFTELYESVLNPEDVPMVFCLGNHDTLSEWTDQTVEENKEYNSYFGDVYFSTDVDLDALDELACRHCIVNGYHVLAINPCNAFPVSYSNEAKEWLDNTLKEIITENPNQYVIVLTHPMIYDTVYGSTLGTHWYSTDLTSILEKYPQVVTFSGHLHFPLNDPRSIMQTGFTALGCGSVKYMAIEDGNYMFMSGSTTMKDKDIFSQGLLVEVDENGNMRFIRMDFFHEEVIGENWEISHPDENNTHLTKYTKNRGNDELNVKPSASSSLSYSYKTTSSGKLTLTVDFAASEDDEFAHDYALTISQNGQIKKIFKILSDFYIHSSTADMKKEYSIELGNFSEGIYEAELVAYDSWGAASDPATITIELISGQEPPIARKNAPLSIYADFDFVNGMIVEKTGNVKVANHDATVADTKVTFDGKEYHVEALNTSGDKYVLCTFTKLAVPDDVQNFAENGFSVEAFYHTNDNGKVQGVVCGTQSGGWGIAVTAEYKPYFITGYGTQGKYNPSVVSSEKSSKTDLVHVVAVYDVEELTSSIYINGELKAVQNIAQTFGVGQGLTFNMFCLGADITSDLQGNDFQSLNMTILDAKIYTGVLNQNDVNTAYANAIASLSNSSTTR